MSGDWSSDVCSSDLETKNYSHQDIWSQINCIDLLHIILQIRNMVKLAFIEPANLLVDFPYDLAHATLIN